MYIGKPGYKFNGGCTILRQQIVETTQDGDRTTIKAIVLAFTSKGSAEPFVTWNRWVSFDADGKQYADTCSHGHYFRELTVKAIEDFESRVEDITHDLENEATIRERGMEDGKQAATWLIDGNTQDPLKVLSALLDGIHDGDPAILDQLPHPRVGGEFADDPTWEDICKAEIDRYEDGEDDLYAAYVDAFHDGVAIEIEAMYVNYQEKETWTS